MSAATAPKPDEAPEPASDAEGWALLEALRRRLDEQATQGRKTAAQVTQLADSIAALVAQQRRRSLWLNVNSFVAYLMFTLLCAAGCYLLYLSRARELTAARDQAVSERDTAVRHADEATVRAVAREAAGNKAWEVYQLLEAGKRPEAVAKLDALRDQPLSRTERAVLAARVHDTQVMEVDAALRGAAAAFKAGRPADVVKPLEAALAGEPPGARAALIHYYLGVAYARTELGKAASHLQAAVAGDVDQEDARFQLASVLDRSGAFALARAEYDRFATAHPQSQLAMFAMRRSATLARMPAVAPAGAAPGPAAPASGGFIAPAAGAGGPAALPPSGTAGSGAPGAPSSAGASGPGGVVPGAPQAPMGAPAGPRPPGGVAPAGPRPPVARPWVKPGVPPPRPFVPARPAPRPGDPDPSGSGPAAPSPTGPASSASGPATSPSAPPSPTSGPAPTAPRPAPGEAPSPP
ncbi:MAG TPA: hypothetical protein VFK02_13360 [Kofleriaceae bacterium]|nr:hypothetical protein [Kofleriaceae bacterium]